MRDRLSPAEGGSRRPIGEAGQVLPFFVIALIAITAMAALLFTGASALVVRRQLQNAGDAAALSAANLIQTRTGTKTGSGCSPVASPTPGAPWPLLVTMAKTSVAANAPGVNPANVVVSCPSGFSNPGWANAVIQVDLLQAASPIFGGLNGQGLRVATTSRAINGQKSSSTNSIVTLDPYHPFGWPNGRKGCPAVLISGGPTIVLDGSMQINSACPASDGGGALGTNGNSASVTLNNPAKIRMVGSYTPGPLTLTPAPLMGQLPAIPDPLGDLDPIDTSGMPTYSKVSLSNTSQVLPPGVYVGGIELKNSSVAFLRPGVYVIQDGEFEVGARASVFTIPNGPGINSTTASTWATDCPPSSDTVHTCGSLILNTAMTDASDSIDVQAGATLKMRAYDAIADVAATAPANPAQYTGLLIWQDGTPPATSSWAQPVISLSGGGTVDISGTVYAPQALVRMGGNASGTGGGPVDLTLQFIVYDLEFHGNAAFHFFYVDGAFPRPADYGLIP